MLAGSVSQPCWSGWRSGTSRGLRKTETFIVSNLMLREWDIQPDAKRRALQALKRAGLVKIEPRGKCSPQVTLLVKNGTRTAP
jgi:hypothetical protein